MEGTRQQHMAEAGTHWVLHYSATAPSSGEQRGLKFELRPISLTLSPGAYQSVCISLGQQSSEVCTAPHWSQNECKTSRTTIFDSMLTSSLLVFENRPNPFKVDFSTRPLNFGHYRRITWEEDFGLPLISLSIAWGKQYKQSNVFELPKVIYN
jgi:hypothetical protein